MNGKIHFYELEDLVEFLKAFTGCTATFEVKKTGGSHWVLEFLGGF